jgi:hypothetical protein
VIEELILPALIILLFVDLLYSAVTDGESVDYCVSEISFWMLALKKGTSKFLNQTVYDRSKFNNFDI